MGTISTKTGEIIDKARAAQHIKRYNERHGNGNQPSWYFSKEAIMSLISGGDADWDGIRVYPTVVTREENGLGEPGDDIETVMMVRTRNTSPMDETSAFLAFPCPCPQDPNCCPDPWE